MTHKAADFKENCERINDTFVVKCVEKIKEPFEEVVTQVSNPIEIAVTSLPVELIGVSDWITIFIGIVSVVATGLAAWAAIQAKNTAKQANILMQSGLKPYLIFRNEISDDPYIYEGENWHDVTFSVCNIGNGPLIIQRLDIYINGKAIVENNIIVEVSKISGKEKKHVSVPDYIREEYRVVLGDTSRVGGINIFRNSRPLIFKTMSKETGIPANKDSILIRFPICDADACDEKVQKLYKITKIQCEYRDVFGNIFTFS